MLLREDCYAATGIPKDYEVSQSIIGSYYLNSNDSDCLIGLPSFRKYASGNTSDRSRLDAEIIGPVLGNTRVSSPKPGLLINVVPTFSLRPYQELRDYRVEVRRARRSLLVF